ncbi:predicted protein [Sclerotinia sclerotiorum 1980 UF-70]|uniref:Uncharacterized protein n=1 Tax=Sclerotinia sclerotiorum (strain ATCC 18683 / 1980 / Ss-1) TaxID=665079 RepID=A7EX39_SCLS1|nr:predicted protein [Sclerotinia sclerotiorum 1980 UF-70]EDN94031.1 predicted protein [Sclerotinia sclerotiorum 1980 UF-70]
MKRIGALGHLVFVFIEDADRYRGDVTVFRGYRDIGTEDKKNLDDIELKSLRAIKAWKILRRLIYSIK